MQQAGEPSTVQSLPIIVNSQNDHSPSFSKDQFQSRVSETDPVGTYVQNVQATDPDIGAPGKLRYRSVHTSVFCFCLKLVSSELRFDLIVNLIKEVTHIFPDKT